MSHIINYQFIHLIWPTKDLKPLISSDTQSSLLGYLTGIIKGVGGILISSGGTSNHVHLLVNVPTNLSLSELLSQIKSCSCRWYREKYKAPQLQQYQQNQTPLFGWNEGYSAFTVSPSSIANVKEYLALDQHRHVKESFEDELIGFLKTQEIQFNPKFLTSTTYAKLVYHFVWSVKDREPMLDIALQAPLHERIQQEIEKEGGKLFAIGNVADHIHLLMECTSKTVICNLVQNLKTTTTHLIKSKGNKCTSFSWQEGYGVFSVGKSAFETVKNYVNNQEAHHKLNTFEHEWNWFKANC